MNTDNRNPPSTVIYKRYVLIAVAGAVLGVIGCMVVLTGTGAQCVLVPTVLRSREAEENRLGSILDAEAELRSGMRKEEVEAVVGLPDNTDLEYVWMWARTRPRWVKVGGLSWREIVTRDDFIYLLFDARGSLMTERFIKDGTLPASAYVLRVCAPYDPNDPCLRSIEFQLRVKGEVPVLRK